MADNRVLTDQELIALGKDLRLWVSELGEYGRAVEQAVLRRVAQIDVAPGEAMLNAVWNQLGIKNPAELVTWVARQELEARRRERAAYMFGWLDCPATAIQSITETQAWRKRDRRFPLLTKRVPKTVTLSDGTMVRPQKGGDGMTRFHCVRGASEYVCRNKPPYAIAKTPADARLLADLVEHPYDEVPDGD